MMRLLPLLRMSSSRGLVLYVVLPNVAFLSLGWFFFVLHPLFNVDYLVAWAWSAALRPAWAGVLYAVCLLVDAFVSAESIYEFSTADLLVNVQYVPQLDPRRVLTIAGLLAGGIAIIAFLTVRHARSGKTDGGPQHEAAAGGRARAAVAIVSLAAAGLLSSVEFWQHPFDPSKSVRVVGSRAIEVVESAIALASASDWSRRAHTPAEWRGSALLRDLSARPGGEPPYNVVLVVVESEGLLRNEPDQALVFAPLVGPAISARYRVTRGALRFDGSTLAGELRALCGLRGAAVEAQTATSLPDCLPRLLARRGYATAGFHGNSGLFFDRLRWYPIVGFESLHFEEEMRAASSRPLDTCGTMIRGLCDAEVAAVVERELARDPQRPRFLYWLTLSSHLPVDENLARESLFDCGAAPSLRGNDGPCNLERILYSVHRHIAAMALDPAIAPTRFIVVGDHAPEFPERWERELYDDKRVPYVDLIPRRAAPPGRSAAA